MEKLSIQLSSLWPTIIDGFEKHIENIWTIVFFKTFPTWKENKKTEEITKVLSPMFTEYLEQILNKIGFKVSEGKGFDYIWENILLEGKLSLSKSNSWTGNGFPKANWHLLVKISFNEQGKIDGSFVCLVPLNECKSSWTKSGEKDNFSTLKLRTEDLNKIISIVGTLKQNPVYLKPIFV